MQSYEKRVKIYEFENGTQLSFEEKPLVTAADTREGMGWIEMEVAFMHAFQNYTLKVTLYNDKGRIQLSDRDMQENARIRGWVECVSEYDEFIKRLVLTSDLQKLTHLPYLTQWLEDGVAYEPYLELFDRMRRDLARSLEHETPLLLSRKCTDASKTKTL